MGSRQAFGDFQMGTRLPKALQLQAFLDGCSPPLVQVLGQIIDMDAFGAFLRRFHSDEGQGDGTRRDFADELVGTQAEKIPGDILSGNDRSPGIHCYQEKRRVHDPGVKHDGIVGRRARSGVAGKRIAWSANRTGTLGRRDYLKRVKGQEPMPRWSCARRTSGHKHPRVIECEHLRCIRHEAFHAFGHFDISCSKVGGGSVSFWISVWDQRIEVS
ncbi:hypothetical protein ACSSV4_003699 [Roseovarius sp. MBR-154]